MAFGGFSSFWNIPDAWRRDSLDSLAAALALTAFRKQLRLAFSTLGGGSATAASATGRGRRGRSRGHGRGDDGAGAADRGRWARAAAAFGSSAATSAGGFQSSGSSSLKPTWIEV